MNEVRIFHDVIAAPSSKPWTHEQFLFHRRRPITDINTNHTNFAIDRIYQAKVPPGYMIPAPQKRVERAVFGGWFHEQFGHFLTEDIVRMWYLQHEKDVDIYFFAMDQQYCRLVFKHILEFQDVMDFRTDQIKIITQPTLFGELVIPNRSIDQLLRPNHLLKSFNDKLNWTPSFTSTAKKVYFKRGDPRWNGEAMLLGEAEFEKYIETQGYKIVDLVKDENCGGRTVSDQFEYIRKAEVLIVPEGSAAYWTLLSENSNKRMVILSRRPEWSISETQCTGKHMAKACNQWIRTEHIEEIVSYTDEPMWEHKTVTLDWYKISARLKEMNLVQETMKNV
jgi:capsular polysaccharide biosynthesis protein